MDLWSTRSFVAVFDCLESEAAAWIMVFVRQTITLTHFSFTSNHFLYNINPLRSLLHIIFE